MMVASAPSCPRTPITLSTIDSSARATVHHFCRSGGGVGAWPSSSAIDIGSKRDGQKQRQERHEVYRPQPLPSGREVAAHIIKHLLGDHRKNKVADEDVEEAE